MIYDIHDNMMILGDFGFMNNPWDFITGHDNDDYDNENPIIIHGYTELISININNLMILGDLWYYDIG